MSMPILTTVTPYWGRPEALRAFLRGLRACTREGIVHVIYFVQCQPPEWFGAEATVGKIEVCMCPYPLGTSIGHYHNHGFHEAKSPWVMKLDIDCVPHPLMFDAILCKLIPNAGSREWFNLGMYCLDHKVSNSFFHVNKIPMGVLDFYRLGSQVSNFVPLSGSNFLCRREDYFSFGGCDPRFRGYGWEDYQQLYGLEENLKRRPLFPSVNLDTVTTLCRENLSRKKALMSKATHESLFCIHRWHPTAVKERDQVNSNRQVLLDSIRQITLKRELEISK